MSKTDRLSATGIKKKTLAYMSITDAKQIFLSLQCILFSGITFQSNLTVKGEVYSKGRKHGVSLLFLHLCMLILVILL